MLGPEYVVEGFELVRKIEGHLGRIADALEADHLTAAIAVPASIGCPHPEKARVDLGDGDWECVSGRGGCGFRQVAEETN